MVTRLRAWWARVTVEVTWLFILALPRARRQEIIDGAIRDVPGWHHMSILDQDAAIARYALDRRLL